MHAAEYEPAIPASEGPHANALDRAATEMGYCFFYERNSTARKL
jgi:hypothetical protein